MLQASSEQFAIAGLHGSSTVALTRAAGITKPVMYAHFRSKKCLFGEVVEANIEARLRTLDARLSSIAPERHIDWIEGMAEATVAVCAAGSNSAILTIWGLLETPEHGVELHRREVAAVQALWERELAKRLPVSPLRAVLSVQVIPFVVGACLAYGFWLSSSRPSARSARPLAHQFSAGIAEAVSAVLSQFLENGGAPRMEPPVAAGVGTV